MFSFVDSGYDDGGGDSGGGDMEEVGTKMAETGLKC